MTNNEEASVATFPLGGQSAIQFMPNEGLPFYAQIVNDHTVIGSMPSPLLETVTVDPRKIEDPKAAQYDARYAKIRKIREAVQRLFEGVKKRNVLPYARYITAVARKQRNGMTPAIVLWTPEPLKVVELGYGFAITVIPFDHSLVAIDGETQLAARYEAWEKDEQVKKESVPILLVYGKDEEWARQAFHDLNVYGSRPNAAVAISMDNYDPATLIAREIESEVEFLTGHVNTLRRQLRKKDRLEGDVLTIAGLRASIVTLARGISGVAYGAKSIEIPEEDMERVHHAAVAWWNALGEHLGREISDPDSVASAPAAIAALGAVGHSLLGERTAELEAKASELARGLASDVTWQKGEPWSGIAGKFTASGRFSVGGAKETSYLIFHALTDPDQPGYKQIRKK